MKLSRHQLSLSDAPTNQPGASFSLARLSLISVGAAGIVVLVTGLLAYWVYVYAAGAGSSQYATLLGMIFAGSFLLLVLIAYIVYRILAGAVQADLETILGAVHDLRTGRLQREYPLRIKDCRVAVDILRTMAHATPAYEQPLAAEQDQISVAPASDSLSQIYLSEQMEKQQNLGEVSAKLPAFIFRAYDIRGVVGSTLTEGIVYDIGRALGSEAYARGQQSIIVARDGRLSGPSFVAALSKGLNAVGRDVIDIGCVPTPVLYFAAHYLNTGSGVMVTGSHNPPEYNGLKMVLRGETLAEEDIQRIRERIEARTYMQGSGSLREQDILVDYIDTITNDVRLKRRLKVVVDCGNGVAGVVAPRLLRALGCEVVELYCEVDGHFPNHHPDPSQPENLRDLIGEVKKRRADLGLAFDGDGDRLALVDDMGTVIWPDRQMMLYAQDVLARNPGATILFDVKCSRHLAKHIARHGGHPLMWKTGHSLIKRKMKETGALLAGEMSGHIFFKERWFGFDDALYSAARLLEIVSADTQSVSKIFKSLPDAVSTPELRIDLPEGQQTVFMDRLMKLAVFKGATLTTVDGIRADFEDGWGLVRASNTTPSLILRFEANTTVALRRIQEDFRALLTKIDEQVKIPF